MTTLMYSSRDPSAPQLTANSGALIALFDACLVTGYGGKPAAGWTKPFSETNLRAVYRQGAGSNGRYIYLDDSAGAVVRARGFESMTSLTVGKGPFPTDSQASGGVFIQKHDGGAGNGGVREWVLIASETGFWFVSQMNTDLAWNNGAATFFGDIKTLLPNETYNTMLMGATAAQHSTDGTAIGSNYTAGYYNTQAGFASRFDAAIPSHYVARSWHGMGGSVQVGKHFDMSRANATSLTNLAASGSFKTNIGYHAGMLLPNPADGALWLSPLYVHEVNCVRGVMPGVAVHNLSQGAFDQWAVIEGSGDYAGRTFINVRIWYGSLLLETSDW